MLEVKLSNEWRLSSSRSREPQHDKSHHLGKWNRKISRDPNWSCCPEKKRSSDDCFFAKCDSNRWTTSIMKRYYYSVSASIAANAVIMSRGMLARWTVNAPLDDGPALIAAAMLGLEPWAEDVWARVGLGVELTARVGLWVDLTAGGDPEEAVMVELPEVQEPLPTVMLPLQASLPAESAIYMTTLVPGCNVVLYW